MLIFKNIWSECVNLELIEPIKDEKTSKIAIGSGKDGFNVPQAITNRILAFQSIVSLEQKKKFDNVIWDTSVQKYESQDGENESVEKAVRNYRLKFSTKSITQIQSQNKVFVIQGNPPQGATK